MFPFTDRFDVIPGENGMRLALIEKNPGGGAVLPFYYYDVCVDDRQVGKISVRIGDNYHSCYNGHIGYEVNETDRGHHYALSALKLVLPVARYHGMERVYVTCGESNAASRRTIELAGGRLMEIVSVPADYFAWYEGIEDHCIYQLDLTEK